MTEIKSINELLGMELDIPDYQRPYKWTIQNIEDLLSDNAIMKRADLKRFICEKYSKACFQIRNEWMVNHSARVIAVYNGETGGTRNTIVYANKHGVDVINVCE